MQIVRVFLMLVLSGASVNNAFAQLVSRDGPDVVTVKANRLDAPLKLDGRLDEAIFNRIEPIHDFVQQEPSEGMPATERSEFWILYDDTTLYVAARLWETHPERAIANERQRDGASYSDNDSFVLILDTFYDRRDGYFFQTNKVGGMRDQAVANDRQQDSWNGVWDVRTASFDQGWTAELAIPFKTLRYRGGGPQTWGLNLRRTVKWKNEMAFLSLVPAAFGRGGVSRMRSAATLVGLETPGQSLNLEVKPFGVSSLTTDRAASEPFENRFNKDAGIDVKYGLTRGLTADITVNPDFAQIEEDSQVVNLTRFSVFFPEKRTFFLEGQGIFDFGGVGSNNASGDVPLMFYSRRIGLSQGQDVPVVAGGRVTGKAGPFTLGALNIQTGNKASAGAVATNFTALRVKREIFESSYFGVIATRRSIGSTTSGATSTLGADTALNVSRTSSVTAYFAQTDTPGVADGRHSYRAQFDYVTDRYGLDVERLVVGRNFLPDVGYAQRPDVTKTAASGRISRRPKPGGRVRRVTADSSLTYVSDAEQTAVQAKEGRAGFRIEFQNSDGFNVDHTREYELLPVDFRIATGVTVPGGGYRYHTSRAQYTFGTNRRLSGTMTFAAGSLYGGTKQTLTYNSGRLVVTPGWLSMEPGFSLNWVDLPYGTFTARLVTNRFVFTPSPRLLLSSLVQFNQSARTLTSSVRLKWEYTPGSELFLAYSDGRNTLASGFPDVLNRSLVVKVTRLVRF